MKVWILILLSLLVVACSKEKPALVQAVSPRFVTTARATSRTVTTSLAATGSFAAMESADLSSETDGLVATTPVETGAFVAAGAPLVTLHAAAAQLRLEQAVAAERQAGAVLRQAEAKLGSGSGAAETSAEVAAAQANLNAALAEAKLAELEASRAENLLRTGDVSRGAADRARASALSAQSRVDSARQQYQAALNGSRQDTAGIAAAQAGLQAARAQTGLARKALADTVVRAPFPGFISSRLVSPGEYASPQTKLVVIDRVQPIRLLLQVAEADHSLVKPGMTTRVRVAAHGEREFSGRVAVVHPAVNPSSRAVTVEAQFGNHDGLLRPGMFATARVEQPEAETLVVVPASALEEDRRTESRRVWVVEQGKARLKLVRTRPGPSGEALIVSGVAAGSTVITGDLAGLFDGLAVKE